MKGVQSVRVRKLPASGKPDDLKPHCLVRACKALVSDNEVEPDARDCLVRRAAENFKASRATA